MAVRRDALDVVLAPVFELDPWAGDEMDNSAGDEFADPNEILVSRTVVDLTAGSGLEFRPRGQHQLKGVPGSWPTFAALPRS